MGKMFWTFVVLSLFLCVAKSYEISLEDVLYRIEQVDTKLMSDVLYLRLALAKEVKDRKKLEERLNLCQACKDPIPDTSSSDTPTENETVDEKHLRETVEKRIEILTDAFEVEKSARIALKAKVDLLEEKVETDFTELKENLDHKFLLVEKTNVENGRKIENAICSNNGHQTCNSSLECCFKSWTDHLTSKVSTNSFELQALTSETESVKKKLEQSMGSLRDSIAETENRLVDRLAPTNVSFHARVGPSISNVAPWETVLFRSVVSNDGNLYDQNTGVFSVPVNGTYAFFVTIMSKKYQEFVLKVKAKDSMIQNKPSRNDVMWVFTSATSLNSASNMAVLRLREGDTVRVVKYGPWGTTPHYVHHTWSTFSGFLLYKDK